MRNVCNFSWYGPRLQLYLRYKISLSRFVWVHALKTLALRRVLQLSVSKIAQYPIKKKKKSIHYTAKTSQYENVIDNPYQHLIFYHFTVTVIKCRRYFNRSYRTSFSILIIYVLFEKSIRAYINTAFTIWEYNNNKKNGNKYILTFLNHL